jgi:hypothetical protein
MTDFDSFFHKITQNSPYEYQKQMAELPVKDCLIRVPTGCGKTAAVIGAWLWHRLIDPRTDADATGLLPAHAGSGGADSGLGQEMGAGIGDGGAGIHTDGR